MIKEYLEIGEIVGTHGVHGELRLNPWCDSPDFVSRFKTLYYDSNGGCAAQIKSARPHGNVVLLRIAGIDSVEQAQKMRGKILYMKRSDAKLPEGRYFINDLLGCEVTDADSGAILGKITDVSATGANDVWHITKDGKEYLVPAIGQVIVSVDTEAGAVVLRPLKGIFDDEN